MTRKPQPSNSPIARRFRDDKPLYYFFKDETELCKLAGEIEAVAHADFRFELSRIDRYAPAELIGREDELALLNDAWLKVRRAESSRPHALTLNLLGTYLRDAHGGDIRHRDLIEFEEADTEEQSGHAFRVMEAYEVALQAEGEKGTRALAMLRLLGLFDCPATAECIASCSKSLRLSVSLNPS